MQAIRHTLTALTHSLILGERLSRTEGTMRACVEIESCFAVFGWLVKMCVSSSFGNVYAGYILCYMWSTSRDVYICLFYWFELHVLDKLNVKFGKAPTIVIEM